VPVVVAAHEDEAVAVDETADHSCSVRQR
jgi:hypothetical protein